MQTTTTKQRDEVFIKDTLAEALTLLNRASLATGTDDSFYQIVELAHLAVKEAYRVLAAATQEV